MNSDNFTQHLVLSLRNLVLPLINPGIAENLIRLLIHSKEDASLYSIALALSCNTYYHPSKLEIYFYDKNFSQMAWLNEQT